MPRLSLCSLLWSLASRGSAPRGSVPRGSAPRFALGFALRGSVQRNLALHGFALHNLARRFARSFAPHGFALLALVALAFAALACSDLPPPPIGQLRLGLSSGIGDARFRLMQATFVISGAAQLELSSDDSPDGDTLQRALPAGDYSAELLPGWQLARGNAAARQPVAAELVSSNPLDFSIRAGELTTITYQFRTTEGDTPGGGSSGGNGEVRVAIEVDGQGAPGLIFSELMKNPQLLPDSDGEWLELYNGGARPLSLDGCELRRDQQTLPLDGGFTIAPGGFLTFANGDAPGFTPDVLYSGITLPNTGAFTLAVACGGEVLDQVLIESATMPNAAGRSLSLSSTALDPSANDNPANWCDGVSPYNGDFGTPGEANPPCP